MKVRRNISLDEEINNNLAKFADSSNRSVSQWITDRVLDEVKKIKKSGK
ncbi:hypothetical protein [Candidatus Avelusimicrobium sp.]